MNPNAAAGALGVVLCSMVFAVLIGTVVGAVFLRAAVSLYNWLAGGPESPSGVPEPSFGKAMGITFVTTLVNGVVGFVLGLVIGAGAAAGAVGPRSAGQAPVFLAQAVSFPISLLIMAAMLAGLLPTTFGRAFLVTLLYLVIAVVVVGVIAVVVVLVMVVGMQR